MIPKFALSPGTKQEFGILEGYQFGANSSFTIGGEGYGATSYSVKELAAH
jgi:hypothetical protein